MAIRKNLGNLTNKLYSKLVPTLKKIVPPAIVLAATSYGADKLELFESISGLNNYTDALTYVKDIGNTLILGGAWVSLNYQVLKKEVSKLKSSTKKKFLLYSSIGVLATSSIIAGAYMIDSSSHKNEEKKYDLVFGWNKDLTSAYDNMNEIRNELNGNVAKEIRLVRKTQSGEYGVIVDIDESKEVAEKKLQTIAKELQGTEILAPKLIEDQEMRFLFNIFNDANYKLLFNVSYSLSKNFEATKELYSQLVDKMGDDFGKNLVIEKTQWESYVIVSKHLEYKDETERIGKKQARKLSRNGIKIFPGVAIENNNEIVYGESDMLAELIKKDEILIIIPSDNSSAFEKELDSETKHLKRKYHLTNARIHIAAYDLTTGKEIVTINADEPDQLASMVKPIFGSVFMQKVENGELDYGNNSERNMRKMLVNSNNNSTNWILKQAGGINSVNRALSKNPYANVLLNEKIVEGIPAGGKAYANLASANDLCRLMTALYNEELPGSEEILKHMKHRKGKGNRIYSGNDIPGGVLVYNKTGSTGHCIGDFGILIPRDDDKVSRPYALAVQVVVPTKGNYNTFSKNAGNLIRDISEYIYQEYMAEEYELKK